MCIIYLSNYFMNGDLEAVAVYPFKHRKDPLSEAFLFFYVVALMFAQLDHAITF